MILDFICDQAKISQMSAKRSSKATSQKIDKKITKKANKKRDQREEDEILDGLEVVAGSGGDYVKIDKSLLKRLRPVDHQEEQIHTVKMHRLQVNPFENFPDFSEVLINGTPLSIDLINKYSKNFNRKSSSLKMGDLLGNLPIELVALKYGEMRQDNWEYNIKVSNPPKISDQEAAGLCWLHAATNVLRYGIMKKFQVESRFELSQPYLYFYDKIERCNVFFENMWQMRHQDIRDFKVYTMADPASSGVLLSDGGMTSFFTNLINKYGIVPKNVYGGSLNCRSSETMNEIIMKILVRMALPLFKDKTLDRKKFDLYKGKCMSTIYDVVARFLGEPPKPTDTFDWTYKDVNGETHTIKNLTPEKFYRIIVPYEDSKVTIIHDPRHPETVYMSSWVEYGVNMQGQLPTNMINLTLESFKRVITESLKNDEPVWFACDVTTCFDPESKTWDTKRFDYESVLGTPLEFDKGEMLETLASRPCHAMVIAGVDTIEDNQGNTTGYKKWRIFNSWGFGDIEHEKDEGFYRMTDEYFDRYVTMAVVDLKYFEPEETQLMMKNAQEGKCYTYKFTDAFGAVARPCSHCHNARSTTHKKK